MTRTLALFLALALSPIAADAAARGPSAVVNTSAARTLVKSYVKGGAFDTGSMHGPHEELMGTMAPSLRAMKAADRTFTGFRNFSGLKGDNYVVHDRASKPYMLTLATGFTGKTTEASEPTYFVLRDGKSGTVAARGTLTAGKLSWRRTHNDTSSTAPAERDASK